MSRQRPCVALICLVLAHAAWAQTPLAGYEMDEGSGQVIGDCSGTGHDNAQNPTNATFVSPGFDGTGSALHFDGDDWVKAGGDIGALEPPHVTVVAHIRTAPGGPGIGRYLMTKGANGNQGGSYSLYTLAEGGLRFLIGNQSGSQGSTGAGVTAPFDGAWHQVMGSFDGTTLRLYVDGVLRSSAPASGPIGYDLQNTHDNLMIGQYDNGGRWVGDVDRLRIYGQALEPHEIPDDCFPRDQAVPPLTGSMMGGSGSPGGVDYRFASASGTLSANHLPVGLDELAQLEALLVDPGTLSFSLPTDPALFWDIELDGSFSGCVEPGFFVDCVELTIGYDDAGFLPFFQEDRLQLFRFDGSGWVPLPILAQDEVANTLTVLTPGFSPFALGLAGQVPALGRIAWGILGVTLALVAVWAVARRPRD